MGGNEGRGSELVLVSAAAPGGVVPTQGGYDGLVMHCSPAEALKRVQELRAFVREVMVQDVDFGIIPGCDKPSLYQPGAQKLCELYGLTFDFDDLETVQDWERAFFFYRKRCRLLLRRGGVFAGAGLGSCNSRESKYAGRWAWESEIPPGLDPRTLARKEFPSKDGRRTLTKYRIPNDDIYSQVNTIEKMACKRALVGAVIGVTRVGNIFTQDVEDLPDEVFGEPEAERSWEKGAPRVVLDEPGSSSPAEQPAETFAQKIARIERAIGEATTLQHLEAIRLEATALRKGPDRQRLVRLYNEAKERVAKLRRAAAEQQQRTAEQAPPDPDYGPEELFR